MSNLTNNTASLETVMSKVNGANNEVNTQSDLIAQVRSALSGKSVSGSGGSGVEYEIITIPAGSTSATYTLPRVTNAYGVADIDFGEYNLPVCLSIRDHLMYCVTGMDGDFETISTDSFMVYYSQGIITINYDFMNQSLTLLLINDPSAAAISDI